MTIKIKNQKSEVRNLNNCAWYWIPKAVIKEYTPKVGSVGIVVYNFLASCADKNQHCFPSQKYMADNLGLSRATVNKAIRILENNKLIRVDKRSRYHCKYYLLKVRCKAEETEMSTTGNSDVQNIDTNDKELTKNINNIDIVRDKYLKLKRISFKGFTPKTKEELLAVDLAQALNDEKGLALYLSYAKKYPEHLLRETLGQVKEIPTNKIKKTKGALFNHLIQKYAQETKNNHRD